MNADNPFKPFQEKRGMLFAGMLAAFLLSEMPLSAQITPKPPPPTVGGTVSPAQSDPAMPIVKPPPITASEAAAAQMKPPPAAVVDAFKAAYRKAGRPRFLVLVGIARDPVRESGQGGIVGGAARGVGVGDDLDFTDRTGITELLGTNIGAILNDDGTVRLVDPASLVEKDRREGAALAQNNEDAAVDAMARKVNADLVLFIKFRPLPAAQRRGNDFSFSCISELKLINTATKVSLTGFQWDGPLNNERARIYAASLSEYICEAYQKMIKGANGLMDMSVKIIGAPSAQFVSAIRRGLRGSDNVEGNVDVSTEDTTTTYEFQFRGDSSELLDEVSKYAKSEAVELTTIDQKKNSLIFRAGEGIAGPDWWLITDAKANPIKDSFAATYKKNPLRVALVCNWLVAPSQMGRWEQWYLRDSLVRIQSDVRLDNNPYGPQLLELKQAATELQTIFSGMGVKIIDAAQVKRIAQQEGDKAAALQSDGKLAEILKNDDGFDLICVGSYGGTATGWDFSIVNRKNANWIGGVTWPASSVALSQDPATRRKLENALKNPDHIKGDATIIRYLAGKLLLAIKDGTGAKATLAVTVRHAPDLAAVRAQADILSTILEVNSGAIRLDNSQGKFDADYTGSFQDLEERIRRVLESKPSIKVIRLDPSALDLDVVAVN